MDFAILTHPEARKQADLLVVPFWKRKKAVKAAVDVDVKGLDIALPLSLQDFKGKEGEILIVYVRGSKEKRVALLGLGDQDKVTTEVLRRAYAAVVKSCNQRHIKDVNILHPLIPGLAEEAVSRGMLEGLLLANYNFDQLKHDAIQDNPSSLLRKVTLIGAPKSVQQLAKKSKIVCEGVYLARNLVNRNADEVTPQFLAKTALEIAKKHPQVKATVFNKKRIAKEKMGLLLAVTRGSDIDPSFIILEYKGRAKAKDHTVIVGKGITYDTGGLNLKSSGMDTMKCDMGGAAVALAAIQVAAKLELPIHLTAVIPTAENSISARSYKPGDVYTSYSGKTVEITNTDAEGRLVLADALAYTVKNLKPSQMVVFATLTGGIEIALGSEFTGMMSNDDALADLFLRAGSETFERVWRLPLAEEYKDNLRSDVADIKNAGTRSASSITAATFTQQFVGNTPWVHFDIASTAFLSEAKRYHPKFGTGIGVRLMIEFLEPLQGLG